VEETTVEKKQTLTKNILKNAIRQNMRISENTAEELYNSIIDTMNHMFQENDYVKISDFGTFSIRQKAPRLGRNPKTKEEVMISTRKSIRFRPSKTLREIVSKGKKHC
jgi:integration host factor subunit alpha